MGTKDDYQYDYLDDYMRFADQVNGALFGGNSLRSSRWWYTVGQSADGTVQDACTTCWISMTR